MTDSLKAHDSPHIVLAGGGSGGHLTPAIAVAEALLRRDSNAHLTFLTSGRDVDRIVLGNSFVATDTRCTIVRLPVTQPPRFGLSGPLHVRALWKSVLCCVRLLKQLPAGAMLATGAFASVPGLLAAKRLKIPVLLFEANAVCGKVNRWWARHASLKLSGWPPADAKEDLGFQPVGMPIRSGISSNVKPESLEVGSGGRQILILGGSQGSRHLNKIVGTALSQAMLPEGWRVLHQTGSNNANRQPDGHPQGIRTIEFLNDVGSELNRSAFVISRAGAVTLGELAATGSPSILVPLNSAAGNHQHRNAEWFAKHHAALLIDESSPQVVDQILSAINRLVIDVETREAMSQAARSLHQSGADDEIAKLLISLSQGLQTHD